MSINVKKSQLWTRVYKSLYQNSSATHDDFQELHSELLSAANWSVCYETKRHPLTTDDEWEIIEKHLNDRLDIVDFTEALCREIFDLLCEKRFEVFLNLLLIVNH